MLADYEIAETIRLSNTVVLDLNGKKVTAPDTGSAGDWYGFVVDEGGDLTLKDSVGTGELYAKCYGVETKGGSFTMESGKITATRNTTIGTAIVNYGGTVTVNGGTIAGEYSAIYTAGHFANAATTINGGSITGTIDLRVDCIDNCGGHAAYTKSVTANANTYAIDPDFQWVENNGVYVLTVHEGTPSGEWSYDAEYHWYTCSIEGCTEVFDKAAHDDEATGLCTVCGNLNYSGATSYTWDFNNSLYAYDANGKIANSFDATPVEGTLGPINGYLCHETAPNGLVLKMGNPIVLDYTKNWSIEYKNKSYKGKGGLFSSNQTGGKNTWVMLNDIVRLSFTRYSNTNVAYNYGASSKGGINPAGANDDIIKYVNTYNPETGKNTISLYKNGTLLVENIMTAGDKNGTAFTEAEKASGYLDGATITFNYLGNSANKMGAWIDYIKVDLGN